MLKCPFCQYPNEEGALFCEQCKSDLGIELDPFKEDAAAVAVPVAAAMSELPLAMPVSIDMGMPFAEIPVAESATISVDTMPLPQATLPLPISNGEVRSVNVFAGAELVARPAVDLSAADAEDAAKAMPASARPRLLVLRGLKMNLEYPLYPGLNYLGRADEKPVDIDLEDQEAPDRIWTSRQHAVIAWEDGRLCIEDLNSSNGTFINRKRIPAAQKVHLNADDVIQVGTVQLKVKT